MWARNLPWLARETVCQHSEHRASSGRKTQVKGPQNVQGRESTKKPHKALEPLNTPPFCQNYLQICDFCKEQILVSFHKLLFSTSLMFHRSLQTQVVKPWKHRWTWVEPRNAQHAISCLILWHSEQLPGLSKGSAFSCLLERQARSPPSVISSHAENSASQWHFSFSGWNYGE